MDLRKIFNDVYNTASVRHTGLIQMVEVNLSIEHKHTRQVLSLPSVLLSMYPLREMQSLNNAIVRSLTNIPIFTLKIKNIGKPSFKRDGTFDP